jgi:hypothetical protein
MPVTYLTPHFTLDELTVSTTADQIGDDNQPDEAALSNLIRLANTLLQPIRDLASAQCGTDVPIHVHDAYRSARVNAAVGGVPASQHQLGEAADVDAKPHLTIDQLFRTITRSDLPYDQVILEPSDHGGCVHVSVAGAGRPPRREALLRTGDRPHWAYQRVAP